MKISNIKLHNWKSFKDIDISINDLMIIIGQNNHGKSNLLSSLLFFFDGIKIKEDDYFKGAEELFVEVEFKELTNEEQTTFAKYVTEACEMKVRKTVKMSGTPTYNGYTKRYSEENAWLEDDEFKKLLKNIDLENSPLSKLKKMISSEFEGNSKTKQVEELKSLREEYIRSHGIKKNYVLEESNFLGKANIAQGLLGDVYYLPALKDTSDELNLKASSMFGKLYNEILLSDVNQNYSQAVKNLQDAISVLNQRNGSVEKEEDLDEISKLENDLSNQLKDWGTEVKIQFKTPDVPEVMKSYIEILFDDGVETDISHKGNGLQRTFYLSLIKLLAERSSKEVGENETSTRQASKSKYFLFEEPELFLHPQAQKQLFDDLVSLSEGNQVFVTTHSNNLIDLEKYKSICIVRKTDSGESEVSKCDEELFQRENDRDKWKYLNWINAERSELFFADKVILVEGDTEAVSIPSIAKKLGIYKHSFTIINCGSKDNIQLYMKLLNKFKIPYVAIYDVDHQEGKSLEAIAVSDRSTRAIRECLDENLGSTISMENDFEDVLGYRPSGNSKPLAALEWINNNQIPVMLENKINEIYMN